MKLLIDGRVLDHTHTGIAIYFREVLGYLENCTNVEKCIIHHSQTSCNYYDRNKIKWIKLNSHGSGLKDFLKDLMSIQRIIRDGGWDIFYTPVWFPHFVYKPKNLRLIVTMHDLIYLRVKSNYFRKLKSWTTNFLGGCIADRVLTVSDFSKKDITRTFPWLTNKIKVINAPLTINKLAAINAAVIERLCLKDRKYFLFVSALRPYKGFDLAIKALERLEQDDISLVVVGTCDNTYTVKGLEELMKKKNVTFTGYLEDSELNSLYKNAICLLFPSKIEGFGSPIIEAQYHKCPVITSPFGAMAEVGGDSVYYMPEYSAEGLAIAMKDILNNEKLREELVSKGLINIQRFLPEKVVPQILREIFGEKASS